MKIEVKNCFECPFANNDNEYGRVDCGLAERLRIDLGLEVWGNLPHDRRHAACPMTSWGEITISPA
jgi:hypothetical protein